MLSGTTLSIHQVASSEGNSSSTQLTAPRRALCLLQQQDEALLAGLEDGSMALWDVRSRNLEVQVSGHKTRIRALAVVTPGEHGVTV